MEQSSAFTRRVVELLGEFLGNVPGTTEPPADEPEQRARSIARKAATEAAAVSGTLALPPGPMGMLTILPDLLAIWKIQAHMVANIAGAYGKQGSLTREQMAYCLFRHASAVIVRDFVVRAGERFIVQQASSQIFTTVLKKLGINIGKRLAGKSVSRWLGPLAALGVAGYAYYDTAQVAKTAIEFFSTTIEIQEK